MVESFTPTPVHDSCTGPANDEERRASVKTYGANSTGANLYLHSDDQSVIQFPYAVMQCMNNIEEDMKDEVLCRCITIFDPLAKKFGLNMQEDLTTFVLNRILSRGTENLPLNTLIQYSEFVCNYCRGSVTDKYLHIFNLLSSTNDLTSDNAMRFIKTFNQLWSRIYDNIDTELSDRILDSVIKNAIKVKQPSHHSLQIWLDVALKLNRFKDAHEQVMFIFNIGIENATTKELIVWPYAIQLLGIEECANRLISRGEEAIISVIKIATQSSQYQQQFWELISCALTTSQDIWSLLNTNDKVLLMKEMSLRMQRYTCSRAILFKYGFEHELAIAVRANLLQYISSYQSGIPHDNQFSIKSYETACLLLSQYCDNGTVDEKNGRDYSLKVVEHVNRIISTSVREGVLRFGDRTAAFSKFTVASSALIRSLINKGHLAWTQVVNGVDIEKLINQIVIHSKIEKVMGMLLVLSSVSMTRELIVTQTGFVDYLHGLKGTVMDRETEQKLDRVLILLKGVLFVKAKLHTKFSDVSVLCYDK
jgi:hypothetical protein